MISPEELKVELYDPRPKGGMQVAMTPTGVKVTHIPTGTIAIVTCWRSSHKNRTLAQRMIEAALTDPEYGAT